MISTIGPIPEALERSKSDPELAASLRKLADKLNNHGTQAFESFLVYYNPRFFLQLMKSKSQKM